MNTVSFNHYLSSHIYDNLVPKNDFLRQLNELFDWQEMVFDLKLLSNNDHGGRPRYNPELLFKMLFLSFLFNSSDRDTEELCANNIRCKYFLGLDITDNAPDFTTLSNFRNEQLEKFGADWLDEIFSELIIEFKKEGITFGKIFALDATHTVSDVDTHKDKERQEQGAGPRDKDARWGAKGLETRLMADGKKVKTVKYFHGYKAHLLAETKNGLVTKLETTPGNTADIDAGEDILIKKLNDEERKQIGIITADKAYGDGVLIGILERDYGLFTALGLNGQFFKGKYKKHWEEYRDDPRRTAAKKKRYVVERINADLKNNHGLRRARYLGLLKYHLQATMAVMAHNLKIVVRELTGARLRPA